MCHDCVLLSPEHLQGHFSLPWPRLRAMNHTFSAFEPLDAECDSIRNLVC